MVADRKVLVVDDDEDFMESVRSLLEAEGYMVIEASSGREGLQKLVQQRPDVIVLDIMMESTTEGYGVNSSIKYRPEYEEYRDIPIIMVSSIQESPEQRFPRAEELGMIRPDEYLTKPLDIPRFLAVLNKALQSA